MGLVSRPMATTFFFVEYRETEEEANSRLTSGPFSTRDAAEEHATALAGAGTAVGFRIFTAEEDYLDV